MKIEEINPVGLGSMREDESNNKIDISGLGENVHRSNRKNVVNEFPGRNRLENNLDGDDDEEEDDVLVVVVDGVVGLSIADVYSCIGVVAVDANTHNALSLVLEF